MMVVVVFVLVLVPWSCFHAVDVDVHDGRVRACVVIVVVIVVMFVSMPMSMSGHAVLVVMPVS